MPTVRGRQAAQLTHILGAAQADAARRQRLECVVHIVQLLEGLVRRPRVRQVCASNQRRHCDQIRRELRGEEQVGGERQPRDAGD